ncbi:unnamed protein product, partial [Allacma fusca]
TKTNTANSQETTEEVDVVFLEEAVVSVLGDVSALELLSEATVRDVATPRTTRFTCLSSSAIRKLSSKDRRKYLKELSAKKDKTETGLTTIYSKQSRRNSSGSSAIASVRKGRTMDCKNQPNPIRLILLELLS